MPDSQCATSRFQQHVVTHQHLLLFFSAPTLQAAHAYDAAARSIRGASAICNFPESDDERRNAINAARGGHVPFTRPTIEGVHTRTSMPRRGSSQLDEDGSPGREIPIVTGRPGGRPGTRAAAAAAAKAAGGDSDAEYHPAAVSAQPPRPRRRDDVPANPSAAPGNSTAAAAARAVATLCAAAPASDVPMGVSPMLGSSPMLGLGTSPALMGASPVLPGMGHGPASWGQLPLPGSLGMAPEMPADFMAHHATDFNMGVGSFDMGGSFPNLPSFPGSLGKAAANMAATAAANGFGMGGQQQQGAAAAKPSAAAVVTSILEDDGDDITHLNMPGVNCPVGAGGGGMDYHDEYEDDLMGQMEVDEDDGSGSGDLSGCSPGTAAVFEELMMGANWGS